MKPTKPRNKKPLTIRFDPPEMEKIEKLARQRNVDTPNRSAIVREFVRKGKM